MKRHTLKLLGIPALSAAGLLAFSFHPYGAVRQEQSHQALLAGAAMDARTAALIEHSCQDCHSERTVWPWYSYLPPASWLVERDVHEARAHMNLSRWAEYSAEKRQEYLGAIAAAARNGQMPPGRFTLLHPEAKLSTAEREQIYVWARGERRRLRRASEKKPVPASEAP